MNPQNAQNPSTKRSMIYGVVLALVASMGIVTLQQANTPAFANGTECAVFADGALATTDSAGIWQISTSEALSKIAECSQQETNAEFLLIEPIELTSPIGVAGGALTHTFSGTLNGGGKLVTLSLSESVTAGSPARGLGMFSRIDGATISNLVLAGVVDGAGQNYVGALAGVTANSTVHDIRSTTDVVGAYSVGGLVGAASATSFSALSVNSSLRGIGQVGGLAGDLLSDSNLSNSTFSGTVDSPGGYWIGGIVGWLENSVTTGVNAAGSISAEGSQAVGGIVGYANNFIVRDASAALVIEAGAESAGVIGYADDGQASRLVFTGSILGVSNVGGLVGYGNRLQISESRSVADLSGSDLVGGAVGSLLRSTLSQIASTGTISGSDLVGGLVGQTNYGSIVVDSSFEGQIFADGVFGGLVGSLFQKSTVLRSYVAATISATGTNDFRGALVGEINNSYIGDSFWNKDSTNLTQSSTLGSTISLSVRGLSSFEMRNTASFDTWDFNQVWTFDCSVNSGFPVLQWAYPNASDADCLSLNTSGGSQTEAEASGPSPAQYTGPQITGLSTKIVSVGTSQRLEVTGLKLTQVTGVTIDGFTVSINSQTDNLLVLVLPALTPGEKDIVFIYGGGARLTYLQAFSVAAQTIVDSPDAGSTPTAPEVRGVNFERSITGFPGDSAVLSARQKQIIRATVRALTGATKMVCVGSTSGQEPTVADFRLARSRAMAVCEYAKMLRPSLATHLMRSTPAQGVGAEFRAVSFRLFN